MLPDDEFTAWFRLLETPGLGRSSARALLAACGSPQAVFQTAPDTLRQIVGADITQALAKPADGFDARLRAALAWLHGGADRHVLALGDSAYPARLLATADPPLLLYVQGNAALLSARSVAIVGSRQATAQGLDSAQSLATALCGRGWVVVSGLAQGIDGAAHVGALAAPNGAGTVAVVGTGLDIVFPTAHWRLAQRIAAAGAIVSEYAPGMPALPAHFPQRNRIIAGLSEGTLVVEAALRSGSLITARMALEAGREVFAMPGSVHAQQSRGCHALIKQGAKLVESAEDILEELRRPELPGTNRRATPASDPADAFDSPDGSAPPEDALLQALGFDPTTLDALQARTGLPTPQLNARLLELELNDQVARLPGGLFQRRHRG